MQVYLVKNKNDKLLYSDFICFVFFTVDFNNVQFLY